MTERRWNLYYLPVNPGVYIQFGGHFPVTQVEWDRMLHLLDLFHDGLVTEEGPAGRTEAQAGLREKVAALLAEAEDDVPHGSARASAYAQVLVLIDQGWG